MNRTKRRLLTAGLAVSVSVAGVPLATSAHAGYYDCPGNSMCLYKNTYYTGDIYSNPNGYSDLRSVPDSNCKQKDWNDCAASDRDSLYAQDATGSMTLCTDIGDSGDCYYIGPDAGVQGQSTMGKYQNTTSSFHPGE